MEFKKNWMSKLKEEFSKSPMAFTLGFGLIQLVLEKLVEADYSCPCDPKVNTLHTSVCFIVPPVVVILLMSAIKCHSISCESFDCQSCISVCEALSTTIISAGVWLIIVFLDGRYYSCAKTNWSGTYEVILNAAPQKWCKPVNSTSFQELLTKTQLWYSESQFIGFWIGLGLGLIFLTYLVVSHCPCCSDKNDVTSRNGGKVEEIPLSTMNEPV